MRGWNYSFLKQNGMKCSCKTLTIQYRKEQILYVTTNLFFIECAFICGLSNALLYCCRFSRGFPSSWTRLSWSPVPCFKHVTNSNKTHKSQGAIVHKFSTTFIMLNQLHESSCSSLPRQELFYLCVSVTLTKADWSTHYYI